MKQRIAGATLALALAGAWPAWALTFATGSYTGGTAQGLRISFNAGRRAVHRLRFREHGSCSNGRRSSGTQGPIAAAIANGRFTHNGVSPSGATRLRIRGKLAGRTASGSFSVTARFNGAGRPDPAGSIVCRTGTVRWSAAHA
jgi:hypothetical protein